MGKKKQKQKEKKFSSDTDSEFENQLRKVGLTIKTILGDGNCLFRSLGDQLEGHSRNHMQIRLQVVEYIKKNREDFEPFIEDDCTFDDHVGGLSENGTYGGNDSIVAFSRIHNCTVYIHQFNAPAFVVPSKGSNKEIHLSYHNGDHYNSVIKVQSNVNNQVNNQENGANSSEKNNNGSKRGMNKANSNANRKQKNNNINNSNHKTGTMNKKSPTDDPHIENLKIDETTTNHLDDNNEKENTSTGTCATNISTKQKPLSRRQKLEQKKKDRKQESLQRKRGTCDENPNEHHHDNSLFSTSNVKALSI